MSCELFSCTTMNSVQFCSNRIPVVNINMEAHFNKTSRSMSVPDRRDSYANDDVFDGYSRALPGLHEWTSWRTKLNSVMVDLIEERHRIFSYPKSKKYIKEHGQILQSLTEPNFAIGRGVSEFALSRAVHDYVHGEDGFHLDAESFLSFGIPRVKLRSNVSYSADSDTEVTTSPTSIGAADINSRDREISHDTAIYSESTKRKTFPKSTESINTDSDNNSTSTHRSEQNGVYL